MMKRENRITEVTSRAGTSGRPLQLNSHFERECDIRGECHPSEAIPDSVRLKVKRQIADVMSMPPAQSIR